MTCVLHHLAEPEAALGELRRVTRPHGRISVLLATNPGLAYRAGRALTLAGRARRAGVADEQRLSHAREHRNHFASPLTMARTVFADDHFEASYCFPESTWHANLATVLQIRRSA